MLYCLVVRTAARGRASYVSSAFPRPCTFVGASSPPVDERRSSPEALPSFLWLNIVTVNLAASAAVSGLGGAFAVLDLRVRRATRRPGRRLITRPSTREGGRFKKRESNFSRTCGRYFLLLTPGGLRWTSHYWDAKLDLVTNSVSPCSRQRARVFAVVTHREGPWDSASFYSCLGNLTEPHVSISPFKLLPLHFEESQRLIL